MSQSCWNLFGRAVWAEKKNKGGGGSYPKDLSGILLQFYMANNYGK